MCVYEPGEGRKPLPGPFFSFFFAVSLLQSSLPPLLAVLLFELIFSPCGLLYR